LILVFISSVLHDFTISRLYNFTTTVGKFFGKSICGKT